MAQLNYEVLKKSGYNGYILKSAPEKVMQFGEGNFLRACSAVYLTGTYGATGGARAIALPLHY